MREGNRCNVLGTMVRRGAVVLHVHISALGDDKPGHVLLQIALGLHTLSLCRRRDIPYIPEMW